MQSESRHRRLAQVRRKGTNRNNTKQSIPEKIQALDLWAKEHPWITPSAILTLVGLMFVAGSFALGPVHQFLTGASTVPLKTLVQQVIFMETGGEGTSNGALAGTRPSIPTTPGQQSMVTPHQPTPQRSRLPATRVPVTTRCVIQLPRTDQFYVQVDVGEYARACAIARTLEHHGFAPIIARIPNEDLLRVLIGPRDNRVAIDQVEADLITEGFTRSFTRAPTPTEVAAVDGARQ